MSDTIRYGFIGTGMMGCEHIRNVRALPGATVVAACDPNERSRGWAVTAAGADLAVYADAGRMLREQELDAVVVASPNHTHREALEPLWETDLHVMVEKPLCTTVDDCLAVGKSAAAHPGVVWVGLEYRYMPAVTRFLHEVTTDRAGDIRMLSIREHRYPFLEKVGHWNRFSRFTGGTLVEKCCHFFDLMNLVLPGRPHRVFASGAQDVNHLDERYDDGIPDVLDNAFVIVDYDDGRRALLDLCMFAEGSPWEQELVAVGDEGKIEVLIPGFMEVSRGSAPRLVIGSRRGDWPVTVQTVADDERIGHVGAHHGASYLEHAEFCEAIRSGAPPRVTVDDGLWSVAMGVAAQRSIADGRAVTLAEVGVTAEPSGR